MGFLRAKWCMIVWPSLSTRQACKLINFLSFIFAFAPGIARTQTHTDARMGWRTGALQEGWAGERPSSPAGRASGRAGEGRTTGGRQAGDRRDTGGRSRGVREGRGRVTVTRCLEVFEVLFLCGFVHGERVQFVYFDVRAAAVALVGPPPPSPFTLALCPAALPPPKASPCPCPRAGLHFPSLILNKTRSGPGGSARLVGPLLLAPPPEPKPKLKPGPRPKLWNVLPPPPRLGGCCWATGSAGGHGPHTCPPERPPPPHTPRPPLGGQCHLKRAWPSFGVAETKIETP